MQQQESSAGGPQSRTYHRKDPVYVLPNDSIEHNRLDLQHAALNKMMSDSPLRACPREPKRILEVGCGTGIMTQYLAERYSQSVDVVVGVDLSEVPQTLQQSTIKFVQGNVLELKPESSSLSSSVLQEGSFDYIFSRLLIFGMTDWPKYLARVKTLLTPGGWFEVQEIDASAMYDESGQPLPRARWRDLLANALANRELDMDCANTLQSHFHEASFEDVHVEEFRWMHGPWRDHPETEEIAQYATSPIYLDPMCEAFEKVLGPSLSTKELEEAKLQIHEEMAWDGNHKYQRFVVVYGRKPEQTVMGE